MKGAKLNNVNPDGVILISPPNASPFAKHRTPHCFHRPRTKKHIKLRPSKGGMREARTKAVEQAVQHIFFFFDVYKLKTI